MDYPVISYTRKAEHYIEKDIYDYRRGLEPVKSIQEPSYEDYRVRLIDFWTAGLRVDMFVEMQLLLLTFSTGIQDAITFPDFRGFASSQTGNTVLLAVGLAGHNDSLFDLRNIGLSLAAFVAGAIFTGQLGNLMGARCRIWQFFINVLQTAMVFGAARVQHDHGVHKSGYWARVALGLLACSAGSQVASARAFKIREITTAMATAAWVDVVIDIDILARSNRPRDRRALSLIALVAGSFAGAFMQARIGSEKGLIISGICKLLVVFAILVTRPEVTDVSRLERQMRGSLRVWPQGHIVV